MEGPGQWRGLEGVVEFGAKIIATLVDRRRIRLLGEADSVEAVRGAENRTGGDGVCGTNVVSEKNLAEEACHFASVSRRVGCMAGYNIGAPNLREGDAEEA